MGTHDAPASYPPSRCTDVTLASGLRLYPELTDSAWCRNITFQDRSLLANPHVLIYDSARIDIQLKATERDRYVMWSAPLMHMYSGDYHFKNSAGVPAWGDVYMRFFQQDNPDVVGSTKAPYVYSASFGDPSVPLPLGQPFNLKVASSPRSREAIWSFPLSDQRYTDANGKEYILQNRTTGHRFITDAVKLNPADTTFQLPVYDSRGYVLIQVVNPYLAWLDVDAFVKGNGGLLPDGDANALLTNGYLFWDGLTGSDFTSVMLGSEAGNGYYWSNKPEIDMQHPTLIPPLQSFFVQKRYPSELLTSLKMSPKWTRTTTSPPVWSYVLRASDATNTVDLDALRIKASQGAQTAYALLRYVPEAAPEYNSREDRTCARSSTTNCR
jgi:hypothetical protein